MDRLKKMFTKKTDETGVLTGPTETYKDVNLTIDKNTITLSGFSDTPISTQDVSELTQKSKILEFFIKNSKYTLEYPTVETTTKQYNMLKQVVTDNSIFRTSNTHYYTYEPDTRKFNLHEDPVIVKIMKDTETLADLKTPQTFFLKIIDSANLLHYEQIRTKTQYYLDKTHNSFVWSVYNEGAFHTFCIEFKDNLDFLEFCSRYVECCYKSVNEEDKFEYFKSISTVALENEIGEKKEDSKWTEYEDIKPQNNEFNKEASTNEMLVVGDNKVFVSRGSSLGVFDVTADDLEFKTHIQEILNRPEKIISYNQNLLVLDKDKKDELQLLDLNRGEVVDRWNVKTDMNDYFASNKTAGADSLIGLSDYSLFRIDPRVKEKVVEKNEYKTKNEFSCGLSTEKGDVAVASRKGDLRLYNKINIRAKSLLPGFGDEVLGIDSSKDGSLILCTCQNYILLYTVVPDYAKPLGKDKPTPKRLQLKPQHLTSIREEIAFTPAKFDSNDSLIVTSTGRYVIRWKVSDVLAGNLYSYSVRALNDMIVDENFVMNGNDIVVALPNDVKKISPDDLKRPN